MLFYISTRKWHLEQYHGYHSIDETVIELKIAHPRRRAVGALRGFRAIGNIGINFSANDLQFDNVNLATGNMQLCHPEIFIW